MGRINGVNSDYGRIKGVISPMPSPMPAPVSPAPTPPPQWKTLELKLFICPENIPNRLEADTSVCEGLNTSCPAHGAGHALVQLHENDGLRLVTDNNNCLQLDQSGNINMTPATTGKVVMTGNVEIRNGVLNILDAGGNPFLSVANSAFNLNINGLSMNIDASGNLTITPPPSGKVTINGDLNVNNLHATGTINGKTI